VRPKGYLIFHLNLGFSSIEEEAWPDVIQTCYHPLLDLIEKTGIPIGIELTGWTLKQIERIDIAWVERFKALLNTNGCELIGSGYCQIIGPLVPHKVNEWNQRLGLQEYSRILGVRPDIALINEMAYSNSLVELYQQFGYRGFIMDRDNVRLALELDNLPMSSVPTHAKGANDAILPVLWSDSILFQKVQHYAHGDIVISDYLDYLKKRISSGDTLLPIYCNDAEVFDYRPGRFSEERPTHTEGEWQRIKNLLHSVETEVGIEWVTPTDALEFNNKATNRKVSRLTSAAHPIPVKKQAKYNIARWAVTGRDDLWLNTMCHRIAKHLTETKNNNPSSWKEMCELWTSDLRTHITEKRWHKAKKQLGASLKRHNISNGFGKSYLQSGKYDSLAEAVGQYGDAMVEIDNDGILLRISTNKIQMNLNLRRGMTIQKLAFASHDMVPCIGTLPHGYFSCISLGADYYSGGVVIELPIERRRITDLEQVNPHFLLKNNGDIQIHTIITSPVGEIIKSIEISSSNESISLNYHFSKWSEINGSIRLGNITLLNDFSQEGVKVLCSNGGIDEECFILNNEVQQIASPSTLVSSFGGLGATTGDISIANKHKKLRLSWEPSECSVMPLLQFSPSNSRALSRVFFSMTEMDDTKKYSANMGSFSLSISTGIEN